MEHKVAERFGMFTIELTRGLSWADPAEAVICRDCETDHIANAIAEARYWLAQIQLEQPQWGATHYRVISSSGAVLGGGPYY